MSNRTELELANFDQENRQQRNNPNTESHCFKYRAHYWIVFAITFFLMLVVGTPLIAESFDRLNYKEVAFKKDDISGEPELGQLYGPAELVSDMLSKSFIKFPSIWFTMDFSGNELAVFTKNGQEPQIPLTIIVRLQPANLAKLYRAVGANGYLTQIRALAIPKIKNVFPQYVIDDVIQARNNISTNIQDELRTLLQQEIWTELHPTGVQLGHPALPYDIKKKYLETAIQGQENEREEALKDASLIRAETDRLVEVLDAETNLVKTEATSNATLIRKDAESEVFNILNSAYTDGLNNMFSSIGINDETTKEDFVEYWAYKETSENNPNAKFLFGLKNSLINV